MSRKPKENSLAKLRNLRDGAYEIGPYVVTKGQSRKHFSEALFLAMRKGLIASGWEWTPIVEAACRELAEEKANDIEEKVKANGFSRKVLSLFQSKTKSEAEQLAREIEITGFDLVSAIRCARDEKFKYQSMFREFVPADISPTGTFGRRTENGIQVMGAPASELKIMTKQINRLFSERRNNHVHLFRRLEQWHCFYFTFEDVKGGHYKYGSHIHYLSHLWGLPRATVWAELRKRRFKLPSAHIRYRHDK